MAPKTTTTVKVNDRAFNDFMGAYARDRFGMVGRRITENARGKAPVRRGHRSFDSSPGPTGGTLRDGITYLVAVGGSVVYAPPSPNGPSLEQTADGRGAIEGGKYKVEVIIGTTTALTVNPISGTARDYGYWVHEGTVRMAARPFLTEALNETDVARELSP